MAPQTPTPSHSLTLFYSSATPASEYALEALHLGSCTFDVRRVDFPSHAPTALELRDLASRLVADPVDALVRRGATYDRLGLDLDGADLDTVIATLSEHPELLHAPILDDGTRVMIGSRLERAEAWAITGHAVDADSVSVLRAA